MPRAEEPDAHIDKDGYVEVTLAAGNSTWTVRHSFNDIRVWGEKEAGIFFDFYEEEPGSGHKFLTYTWVSVVSYTCQTNSKEVSEAIHQARVDWELDNIKIPTPEEFNNGG